MIRGFPWPKRRERRRKRRNLNTSSFLRTSTRRTFSKKDIVGTKITMLTFVWGLIFGVLAGVTNPISPLVGLLLLFAGLYLLKFFYRVFRIKTADIDKKGWAGNIIMFSFLFLGTWIMLLNHPFV